MKNYTKPAVTSNIFDRFEGVYANSGATCPNGLTRMQPSCIFNACPYCKQPQDPGAKLGLDGDWYCEINR